MSVLSEIIEDIQTEVGNLKVDGQFGLASATAVLARLRGGRVSTNVMVASGPIPASQKPVWPLEANADGFYGTKPNLTQIEVPYPMRMEDENGKWMPIKRITCHILVAASLRRVLEAIKAGLGSQEEIQAVGADIYDGVYNNRPVRGSTRRSMHSYGAAIDIDADHNQLGAIKGRMSAIVVAAFKAEGWRWGGDYTGRKDPMHFEACR